MDERKVMTVNITPTWSGIVGSMCAVLENEEGSWEAKQVIREEFARMAQAADLYNEEHKDDEE